MSAPLCTAQATTPTAASGGAERLARVVLLVILAALVMTTVVTGSRPAPLRDLECAVETTTGPRRRSVTRSAAGVCSAEDGGRRTRVLP